MAATLSTSFVKAGKTYVQVRRTGNVAIYRVDIRNRAKRSFLFEVVKILGEIYPSDNPAIAGNRKHVTDRIRDAQRKFWDWTGKPALRLNNDVTHGHAGVGPP